MICLLPGTMVGVATAKAAIPLGGDWTIGVGDDLTSSDETVASTDERYFIVGSPLSSTTFRLQSAAPLDPGASLLAEDSIVGPSANVKPGLDGSVVWGRDGSSTSEPVVESFGNDSRLRWRLPLGQSATFLATGTGGVTFMRQSETANPDTGGRVSRISLNGALEWSRSGLPLGIGGPEGGRGPLIPTPEGLLVWAEPTSALLDYDGSVRATITLSGEASCQYNLNGSAANRTGEFFLARMPVGGSPCDQSHYVVTKVDRTGAVAWSHSRRFARAGSSFIQLSALPNGDVLVNTSADTEPIDELAGSNGQPVQTWVLPQQDERIGTTLAGTDSVGDTYALSGHLRQPCHGEQPAQVCVAHEVLRLHAAGGVSKIGEVAVEDPADQDPTVFGPRMLKGWMVFGERQPNSPTTRLRGFVVPNNAAPYRAINLSSTSTSPPPGTPATGMPPNESPSPLPMGDRMPVVLITGLNDSTAGQGPDGRCGVGSLQALCHALTTRGFPVYVVSSSGKPEADQPEREIDNRGTIDANAKRLAHYLTARVRMPALVVGHSMGGLIARVAISRYQAPALGLFTIGSPHTGSFGADIAEGAKWFPCAPSPSCRLLHAAGDYAAQRVGQAALADLTSVARAWDNLHLDATRIPTWAYAGTACRGFGEREPVYPYVFPNDGIVGKASALGYGARLGTVTPFTDDLWHQGEVRSLLAIFSGCNPSADVELESPSVATEVLAAADQVAGHRTRSMLRGMPSTTIATQSVPTVTSPQRAGASHLTIDLVTGTSRTLRSGARVDAKNATLLATSSFNLICPGHTVQALPALGGKAFGILPGAATCARPRLSGIRRLTISASANPDRVRAELTRRDRRLVVTVGARRMIAHANVMKGSRPVRARTRRLGARTIVLSVRTRNASGLGLRVRVAGRVYQAPISVLP
jgi:pimeloyl-ACP methyl ester carboxylesterase